MKHVEDDSTIVWAIGPDSGVIAKHAKLCGEEVEMVVPFEGANSAEVQYMPICQAFFALGSIQFCYLTLVVFYFHLVTMCGLSLTHPYKTGL